MMNTNKSKASLRKQIHQHRREMLRADQNAWDAAITHYLKSDSHWCRAQVVMAYMAMPTEVGTRDLLELALTEGKTLLLPRCLATVKGFEPVAVANLDTDLVPGPLTGLFDPAPHLPCWPHSRAISLVLLPGLAFDGRGYRLGYGKGMYDRFLAERQPQHTIALAYPYQLVDQVPTEPHDLPATRVLCPNGFQNLDDSR